MPTIVNYQTVLATLAAAGLTCNYHNSGSFGIDSTTTHTVGWLAEADATIRPEMLAFAHVVSPPAVANLLDLLREIWLTRLPGELWIMPASHWAFELTYGNAEWLPQRLQSIGVDSTQLQNRNDGSAIAFTANESDRSDELVGDLLTKSRGSDFTAAWPKHGTVAMLHHHTQIWWRTNDKNLAASLRQGNRM